MCDLQLWLDIIGYSEVLQNFRYKFHVERCRTWVFINKENSASGSSFMEFNNNNNKTTSTNFGPKQLQKQTYRIERIPSFVYQTPGKTLIRFGD